MAVGPKRSIDGEGSLMLKRLLAAWAILAIGASLFYLGHQLMPWVLSHPDVMARLPSVNAPPTHAASEMLDMPRTTETAGLTSTPPATTVVPNSALVTPRATTAVSSSVPTVTRTTTIIPVVRPTVSSVAATYTPIPTPIPALISAPTASYTPVLTPQRMATPTVAHVAVPVLLAPSPDETLRGRVTFRWQPIELPPGAAYEVVWWKDGEDPNQARGLAAPSTNTSQDIDVSGRHLQLPAGQRLYWSVLVVQVTPYRRLSTPQVSTGRPFVFQR